MIALQVFPDDSQVKHHGNSPGSDLGGKLNSGAAGTSPAPENIHRAQIEDCIRRPPLWVRFPADLEACFERDTGVERSRSLFRMGLVGAAAYHVLLLPKYLLLPDSFSLTLKLQLLLVDPLILLTLWLMRRNPRPLIRELSVLLFPLVGLASLTWTTLASSSPSRWVMPQFYVMAFLYVTALQRLRFGYAVLACLLMLPMQIDLVARLPEFDDVTFDASVVISLAASIIALFGNYSSERQQRLSYLLSLLSRFQTRELDWLSRHDPLTGLGNRRLLSEMLPVVQAGNAAPLSVIMLDIDHFKKLNDSAGHEAGDRCLARIAGIIRDELRTASDCAFRSGGEEFLILLPDTGEAEALGVAERIRASLAGLGIPNPGLGVEGRVTISVGVATDAGEPGLVEQLLQAADQALYAAKQAGRNRVSGSVRRDNGDSAAVPAL